jgi:hypothetical protein
MRRLLFFSLVLVSALSVSPASAAIRRPVKPAAAVDFSKSTTVTLPFGIQATLPGTWKTDAFSDKQLKVTSEMGVLTAAEWKRDDCGYQPIRVIAQNSWLQKDKKSSQAQFRIENLSYNRSSYKGFRWNTYNAELKQVDYHFCLAQTPNEAIALTLVTANPGMADYFNMQMPSLFAVRTSRR